MFRSITDLVQYRKKLVNKNKNKHRSSLQEVEFAFFDITFADFSNIISSKGLCNL